MDKFKNNIADISNNYYKYLANMQNVNGIGYGYKYINQKKTIQPCIHVLVENKINSEYLTKNNIVPKEYMGIKTDVIEIGEIKLSGEEENLNEEKAEFPDKSRPLTGGCCIGINNEYSAGTLCCIVSKIIDGEKQYFILSNNHVLANKNKIALGAPILQPAYPLGGEAPQDIIAHLTTFVAIKFIQKDYEPVNFVDAAIAKISNQNLISRYIADIGAIEGIEEANAGMDVQKFGFVSGFSEGYIDSLHVTIPPNIEKGKNYLYKEQIVSKIITTSGDSGCAIVTEDNNIVGMHMASSNNGFSVANNIYKVLEELNIEVYF